MFYRRVKLLFGLGEAIGDSSRPFSLIAAATTNATLVKAGAGSLVSLYVINVTTAVRYLKFYDLAKIPVAGQGTPTRRFAIPASTTGAGFSLQPLVPMAFFNGIAFTLTAGQADNDATALTAGDVVLTLEYI